MATGCQIGSSMFASINVYVFRLDQKQRRNGEACRASPTCFWSSLINLIVKRDLGGFLSIIIRGPRGVKTAKQLKRNRSFVRTC